MSFVLIARRSMQQLIRVKSDITEVFREVKRAPWGAGGRACLTLTTVLLRANFRGFANPSTVFSALLLLLLHLLLLLFLLLLLLLLLLVATCTSNLRARLIVGILRANCGQPQVPPLPPLSCSAAAPSKFPLDSLTPSPILQHLIWYLRTSL